MTSVHEIPSATDTDLSTQAQHTDMIVNEKIHADAATLFHDHKGSKGVQLSGPIKIVMPVEADRDIVKHADPMMVSETPASHAPADAKHTTEADQRSLLPVDGRADADDEDLAPNTDNISSIASGVE
jgi:hypothetical protein